MLPVHREETKQQHSVSMLTLSIWEKGILLAHELSMTQHGIVKIVAPDNKMKTSCNVHTTHPITTKP